MKHAQATEPLKKEETDGLTRRLQNWAMGCLPVTELLKKEETDDLMRRPRN